jgi:guanylate kinase
MTAEAMGVSTAPGLLVVISGPSGVGKSTLCNLLLERDGDLSFSVSATTRPMRRGEREGVDYFFVTEDEFMLKVRNGEFLEWTRYCKHYYGTLNAHVREITSRGGSVLLGIETRGARQVRERRPDAVFVFIAPPSLTELKSRIAGRGTESKTDVAERLRLAEQEMNAIRDYDYVVVNDNLEKAVGWLSAILVAERCRVTRQTGGVWSPSDKGDDS